MNRSRPCPCRQWALLALATSLGAFGALGPQSCQAESGLVEFCPVQPMSTNAVPVTSRYSGMLVRVDTMWGEGYGYRPVRFDFTAPKPSVADRTITVQFTVNAGYSPLAGVTAEESFVMPAGTPKAGVTLIVPRHFTWHFVSWRVLVDGELDEALSRTQQNWVPHPANSYTEFLMLRPGSARDPRHPERTEAAALNSSGMFPEMALSKIVMPLPDEWLHYSSLDVVVLSAAELAETASKYPKRFSALRRWVQSGGTLWVEDTGPSLAQAKQVSQLLKLNQGPRLLHGKDEEGPLPKVAPEWRWVDLAWSGPADRLEFDPQASVGRLPSRRRQPTASSRPLFAEAPLGFGVVAAFPQGWRNGADGLEPLARTAFYSHLSVHSWANRHGVSPDSIASDFASFLIPEVGLAPVNEFQVLITVFVLAVGPLNFWLLNRRQRTHLMVLTVPITALFLTIGLLVYALLSDGLGVQARGRSVTFLDQPRHEQTTWRRTCYYAGFAPAEGLAFDKRTAIYPILSEGSWGSYGYQRTKKVNWNGTQQRLTSGWLSARESTQFLTVESRQTKAAIDFRVAGDKIVATNRLGSQVQYLVALDGESRLWSGESLEMGQRESLSPVERAEATSRLRELLLENEPTPPQGIETLDDNPLLQQQRRQQRRLRRSLRLQYGAEGLSDSLLNDVLDRLVGLDTGGGLSLPPRSYAAICDQLPLGTFGVEGVRESGGFHVVIGAW